MPGLPVIDFRVDEVIANNDIDELKYQLCNMIDHAAQTPGAVVYANIGMRVLDTNTFQQATVALETDRTGHCDSIMTTNQFQFENTQAVEAALNSFVEMVGDFRVVPHGDRNASVFIGGESTDLEVMHLEFIDG